MEPARALWMRVETIHAVIYFAPEGPAAAEAVGITGFWSGYFGFRAAPMGAVGSGVVEATFANFAPAFVRRWVPAIWERATPTELLAARLDAATSALRRIDARAGEVAAVAAPMLAPIVARADGAGRPLFAANREVATPPEPLAALWHWCTCLREHRGDGHVAALTAEGVDGLESHVLRAADDGSDPGDLQRTRGWSADDWDGAVGRLRRRGLIEGAILTPAGRRLRAQVEATTDRLAASALEGVDHDRLLRALDPLARAVSASGTIRYPNPIGVPALR